MTWDPETLNRTALPNERHGELRKNWDKSARALRTYAARISRLSGQAPVVLPDFLAGILAAEIFHQVDRAASR